MMFRRGPYGDKIADFTDSMIGFVMMGGWCATLLCVTC